MRQSFGAPRCGYAFESLGFRPGGRFATPASSTEIASVALVVLGAGGPLGPAALLSTMVVAQTSAHVRNGFFTQNGGIGLGVMYSTAALALASAGFGRLSLDEAEAFGWQSLRAPWVTAAIVSGGGVMGLIVLAQRGGIELLPDGLDTRFGARYADTWNRARFDGRACCRESAVSA